MILLINRSDANDASVSMAVKLGTERAAKTMALGKVAELRLALENATGRAGDELQRSTSAEYRTSRLAFSLAMAEEEVEHLRDWLIPPP